MNFLYCVETGKASRKFHLTPGLTFDTIVSIFLQVKPVLIGIEMNVEARAEIRQVVSYVTGVEMLEKWVAEAAMPGRSQPLLFGECEGLCGKFVKNINKRFEHGPWPLQVGHLIQLFIHYVNAKATCPSLAPQR